MVDRRLNEFVAFARQNSPFYQSLYAGLPGSGLSLTDLPIADNASFWEANTVHNNRLLTAPITDGIVYKTGGTTRAPRLSVYTRGEMRTVSNIWGSGIANAGLCHGDRVANLYYAGELYASFINNLLALQEHPVSNVHLPVGGSAAAEYSAEVIEELSATVLIGPTTTLCKIASFVTSAGRTLPDVKLLLFAGEAFYADQRTLLKSAFPDAEVNSGGYASIDGGMLGSPIAGSPDPRVHRVFSPYTLMEIIDADTGEPIMEPGRAGRVVTTDLVRRLMPIIRYPVGDMAEWVSYPEGIFRLLGRAEDGARIGPVTLFVDDLRTIVEAVAKNIPIAGMQMVIQRREAKDELVLRIAGQPGNPDAVSKAIITRLNELRPMFAQHVTKGLIQPLVIEWLAVEKLEVNQRTGKLVRLIDARSTKL
jgi:phenylacetate-CoA ligase